MFDNVSAAVNIGPWIQLQMAGQQTHGQPGGILGNIMSPAHIFVTGIHNTHSRQIQLLQSAV